MLGGDKKERGGGRAERGGIKEEIL